jgi:hypothetical protein
VSYTKELRSITGWFGAYPLGQHLVPGMIGRRVQGAFVRDDYLSSLPGFTAELDATVVEPDHHGTDAWSSEHVTVSAANLGADGVALPADAKLTVQFSNANQAVFLCQNLREWGFSHPRNVKKFLIARYRTRDLTHKDIVIMRVKKTDASWLFFSSARGQSVDLGLSARPPVSAISDMLKTAIFDGTLRVAHGGLASSGYTAEVLEPATPLFQAIRVKGWIRPETVDVTKGDDEYFEEATFGDPDELDLDNED